MFIEVREMDGTLTLINTDKIIVADHDTIFLEDDIEVAIIKEDYERMIKALKKSVLVFRENDDVK